MKPLRWPTEPPTMTSRPFSEIAQRADASPWITSRPPQPLGRPSGLGRLPAVGDGRGGLPGPGPGSPWEDGDRPPLGSHRHPIVRLREHRRLARDRVAQHREAVGGAYEEGVEAVERVEA